MTSSPPIPLTHPVALLPGVSPAHAAALRRLGVRCVADLILHLPLRYEREHAEQPIAEAAEAARSGAANIAVRGEIRSVRGAPGRRPRVEALLEDESGAVRLTWFNAPWMRKRVHPGLALRAWGRATMRGGELRMANPHWEPVVPDAAPASGREERYAPIYPAGEGITSAAIDGLVERTLPAALAGLDDHVPEALRAALAMPSLAEAYRLVHRPADEDEAARGRRRLAFDELFLLQLGVCLKKRQRRDTLRAVALEHDASMDERICARFPFTLTPGQRRAIDEIVADLGRTVPMNRLLQGDVGAGKTVVALYAMLMAVASGHQAVLMAPTELLAEQHFASMGRMLEGASVTPDLLTGSLTPAARAEVVEGIASGRTDLLVGTHALLTEHVNFRSLAVAVIDEQHRFGVHQRATMRVKAQDEHSRPHVLVMTATPIPRTLSLTVFGDLDVSTIEGMPPGRRPVITRHVRSEQAPAVYAYVAQRVAAGDQAYVVVPAIDESAAGLTDLETHLERLRRGPLAGVSLAAMHGRLTREERDRVMQAFRAGEVKVLLATTVIEVGVDVPAANIMVIENADRFGLAQLHQLRGRVGRSTHQGLCTLIADPGTDDARARLAAITATTDGFLIAEKDLEIRGPGELFGARQSGLPPFRVAALPRDLELLRLARRTAEALIEGDPELAAPEHGLLRKRLFKKYREGLGLGDVG